MPLETEHHAPAGHGDYKPLEAYGIIGNLETVALIGRDGGIDWCCLPRTDSPSVFARLLDSQQGGQFSISPVRSFEATQTYVNRTNVLQTQFETSGGDATVTDFMSIPGETTPAGQRAIYRRVTCDNGAVDLTIDFEPRFDYATTVPTPKATEYGITATGNEHTVCLSTGVSFEISDGSASATVRLNAGETSWFILGYDQPVVGQPVDHRTQLDSVVDYWREWSHTCSDSSCPVNGPWHDLAVRSNLLLKLLIQRKRGTIAAAPTTSLPEDIGGSRNWDYRYNWIRDAAFTVQALAALGHHEEIVDYFETCLTHCAKMTPAEMQPVYGLYSTTDLTEHTLDHLDGYCGSKPIRVGNSAASQRQLDVYGELLDGVYEAVDHGADLLDDHWPLIRDVADHVCEVWDEPDVGIWEVRSDPEQFVYSKVMCWTALDRAIRFVDETAVEGSVDRWNKTRRTIRQTVLQRGFNEEIGSFVRSFEADDRLDAAVLRIPLVGFLPADDPRMEQTIDTIHQRLTTDEGLVTRLSGDDGLPGSEGRFIVCTFWLVNALAAAGRIEEATTIFETVCQWATPLGLLAEEVDPQTGRQVGNIPQAFSHIGVLTSAMALSARGGQSYANPERYPPYSSGEQPSTAYPGQTDTDGH